MAEEQGLCVVGVVGVVGVLGVLSCLSCHEPNDVLVLTKWNSETETINNTNLSLESLEYSCDKDCLLIPRLENKSVSCRECSEHLVQSNPLPLPLLLVLRTNNS